MENGQPNDSGVVVTMVHYVAAAVCTIAGIGAFLMGHTIEGILFFGSALSLWTMAEVLKALVRIATATESLLDSETVKLKSMTKKSRSSVSKNDGVYYSLD